MWSKAVPAAVLDYLQHLNLSVKHSTTCHTVFPEASLDTKHVRAAELCSTHCLLGPLIASSISAGGVLCAMQVQAVVSAMRGSHNRVEAAVCLYAPMVDKENLWLVLYALKVLPPHHIMFC